MQKLGAAGIPLRPSCMYVTYLPFLFVVEIPFAKAFVIKAELFHNRTYDFNAPGPAAQSGL